MTESHVFDHRLPRRSAASLDDAPHPPTYDDEAVYHVLPDDPVEAVAILCQEAADRQANTRGPGTVEDHSGAGVERYIDERGWTRYRATCPQCGGAVSHGYTSPDEAEDDARLHAQTRMRWVTSAAANSAHGTVVRSHVQGGPLGGNLFSLGGATLCAHPEGELDDLDVAAYQRQHATALARPDTYLAAWHHQGTVYLDVARHVGRGGTTTKAPPVPSYITQAEARGNSRPVSREEFDSISGRGRSLLDQMRQGRAPLTGLDQKWAGLKRDLYPEVRKPWGGATIDAHTGVPLEQGADRYALSVKPAEAKSVSIHERAPRRVFESAMDLARRKFGPLLENGSHYLGVFHDDDNRRIDFDPVVVVDHPDDVEAIGAHTHAIGGAYHFATGDGYFPPHVADAQRQAALGAPVTWHGPGHWRSHAEQVQPGYRHPDDDHEYGEEVTAALSEPTHHQGATVPDYSGGWARPDDYWGSYQHGQTGDMIHMYRGKGNRTRFYDERGSQVGPELTNVAPAVAWAMTHGYHSPELAGAGIFPENPGQPDAMGNDPKTHRIQSALDDVFGDSFGLPAREDL